MPPFIPNSRRDFTPPPIPSANYRSQKPTPKSTKKPTLFDTLDSPSASLSVKDNKAFLDDLDDLDSLSDVGSSEFEDVEPSPKRRKVDHESDDEEEMDWEDAIQPDTLTFAASSMLPSGDLELTLDKGVRIGSLTDLHGKKKGPSKIERQIRIATHHMHVQLLLFHNSIRNNWICDSEVQKMLVRQLPKQIKEEVEIWKRASGMGVEEPEKETAWKGKNKKVSAKASKDAESSRAHRDWGKTAERQEKGVPNTSRGDPVIRLLRYLAAYWKKRFRITAPCLRKQGYKSLAVIEEELASFRNDTHNPEEHGERIANIEEFRECARKCEGSRDVGAQLFTALVRGLGIDARLVASLQPIGFGWNKSEEAAVKKKSSRKKTASSTFEYERKNETSGSSVSEDEEADVEQQSKSQKITDKKAKSTTPLKQTKGGRKSKGGADSPIDLSDDNDPHEGATNVNDEAEQDDHSDDYSVIDTTPSTPNRKPNMVYDRDMLYPTYWTEAISPLTYRVYPVETFVIQPAVMTNPDKLVAFEPRGAKAEKAKLIFAYVVAYSVDGTAKEVTTRYLKRHMWPGKTKGVRMPVEKYAELNKRGKVKGYREYDWFKRVMSCYKRSDYMRTAVDDIEEADDLKAVKPEKREVKEGEETLQGYKQSAEYVLERHLRREEALVPGAIPVRKFKSGKGEKSKEEPVYLRKDVMACKTVESWHKEGRRIKAGQQPMKMVPVRAVTLTRKREIEEKERDTGEKSKQGVYAVDQTEYIIPPPIENGVIPKNSYGNMDCFVPTMVPRGAAHILVRGMVKICKRLGIDYAEAVTGFEFGNKRAVPVIEGVVIAVEHRQRVLDEWDKDEAERIIREEGKREKMALAMWRKFLMGLRIIERVREEYGDEENAHMREEINPFTNKNKKSKSTTNDTSEDNGNAALDHGEDMAGDFLLDAGEDDDTMMGGGFFPEGHEEEEIEHHNNDIILIEGHEQRRTSGFHSLIGAESNGVESSPRLSDDDSGEKEDSEEAPNPQPKSTAKTPASKSKSTAPATKRNLNLNFTPKSPPSKRNPKSESRQKAPSSSLFISASVSDGLSSRLSEDSDSISDSEDGPIATPAPGPPKTTPKTRALPKRTASQKKATEAKSPYFVAGSEDDNEEEEEESEDVFEGKRKRGRPAGSKGRGARGRGRARKA
ncbi:MAG: hypothetical protein MMC33_008978 [Icmadophila ericetorum]|nr:hypothetical protein [Icmadophila ericetorum]